MIAPFKLGQVVVERFSGLRGTTISAYLHLNGTLQYGVQPKGDGEKMPDAYSFDYQTLALAAGEFQDTETPLVEVPDTLGNLRGLKAKDKVTGVYGIVTVEQFYYSGCHFVYLQPEATAKAPEPQQLHLPVLRIEVTDTRPRVEPAAKDKPRGGPSRVIAHARHQRV